MQMIKLSNKAPYKSACRFVLSLAGLFYLYLLYCLNFVNSDAHFYIVHVYPKSGQCDTDLLNLSHICLTYKTVFFSTQNLAHTSKLEWVESHTKIATNNQRLQR